MKVGNLDIYRSGVIIATVKIDESTEFVGQINGVNKISAKFRSLTFIDVRLLDYILYEGIKYQLNEFVDMTINEFYNYNVTFESSQYDMLRYVFKDVSGSFMFSHFGDAESHLQKLVDLINTYESGWAVGFVEETLQKTITYNGHSSRASLTLICDNFGLEFIVNGKEISLKKIIKNDAGAIILKYGKGNGLYELNRRLSGEFFTRLIVEGSSRNIPTGYRGGKERLVFAPNGYVDKGVSEYGVFEKAIIFEDIYPHRTGTLTSVTDLLTLADTSIDFNLADNFITGQVPKIVMQSGALAGEEFEIIPTSYDNTTKSFKIKVNYEGAYTYPNSTVFIASGDTYVFVGINLPQSYVDIAEIELYNAAVSYINQFGSIIEMAFALDVDEKFVRDNGLEGLLRLGNKVNIVNTPAGIDVDLRIVSINFPILVPSRIKATISDKVPLDAISEIEKIVIDNSIKTTIVEKKNEQLKAFTSVRLDELQNLVFDPSGNYYTSKIAPLSIETAQLAVGTRSQQFDLTVSFEANAYFGNDIYWTAGKLNHYTVIPGSVYTWNIASGYQGSLNPAIPYYIYARCNKANNTATIVLDTVARQVDSDSTYWWFLVGSVNSVDGGVRRVNLTYGDTNISGKFITTGVVTSADGKTQLDLDAGTFKGRLEFLGTDDSTYIPLTTLNSIAEASKVKTDLIKDWALQDDIIAAMEYGSTFIEGGYVKTVFLDVDTIVANGIYAATIEALDVNFVKGTIGGIEINAGSIESTNGKFKVTSGGIITATEVDLSGKIVASSGTFGNILIEATQIRSSNNKFILTDDGALSAEDVSLKGTFQAGTLTEGVLMSATGMAIYNGAYGGVSFKNDGQNIINGSYLEINVNTGGFQMNGSIGWTSPIGWGGSLAGRIVVNGIIV